MTTAHPIELLASTACLGPPPRLDPRAGRAPLLAALLAAVAGTAFIIATYSAFWQTYDEAAHLACGMELLDRGSYTFETFHPPLARVAAAILPYLAGARGQGLTSLWAEGNAILEHDGHYQRTLTLARLGILPFFWLTCFLVWRFMAGAFSRWHAAAAVFLVAFCPAVLAHSSVATTDAPLMAMFLAALLAWRALLQRATTFSAMVAGLMIALAGLTKFTGLAFLACSGGILFAYYWFTRKRFPAPWRALLLTLAVFALATWAGYRFSHGPIVVPSQLSADEQQKFANLPSLEQKLLRFPYVPAEEFFRGLKQARYQAGMGRRSSYLLGEVYDGGRWYFFPTAILVKTQIPMLLLGLTGTLWLLARSRRWHDNSVFLVSGLIGPLAVGMVGSVNIGLRHILPVYPFLAMLAAVGAITLWRSSARPSLAWAGRTGVILLLLWTAVSCWRAAPDFLAYFNEPAAPLANRILVESDLDWGQDLKRLSARLDQVHANTIWISYFGAPDLSRRLAPTVHLLKANDRPDGWVAISEARLRKHPADYRWLADYSYEPVGRSIRLYHLSAERNAVAP